MDGKVRLKEPGPIDRKAKVVVVTGDIQPQARQRCTDLCALDAVPKPVAPDICRKPLKDVDVTELSETMWVAAGGRV